MGHEVLFVPLVRSGDIEVSENGEIRVRQRNGSMRLARPGKNGYVRIAARFGGITRSCAGHRLLWHVLRGEIPKGLQINHRNGEKAHNALSNLEIVTARGNTLHARDVLHRYWGAANGNARLSERDVLEVRRRASEGEKLDAIAADFGVTREAVRLIARGKRWRKLLASIEEQAAA